MTQNPTVVAANRLETAGSTRSACAPVTDLIGNSDINAAYAVQQILTARRVEAGAQIIGRKIGLTSHAVQRQIGVDRPDFGVLFDDMQFASGDPIPIDRLLQPKVEAEVAFVLSEDITSPIADGDITRLRAAIRAVYPAIEVVDSRIADWQIGITDTVADNASSGVFVLGDSPVDISMIEPAAVSMTLTRRGQIVSKGHGSDCLGDPLNAVAWLANTAIAVGSPLRAGDLILSGALGPMVAVSPGDVFDATIDPLGSVAAVFTGEEHA